MGSETPCPGMGKCNMQSDSDSPNLASPFPKCPCLLFILFVKSPGVSGRHPVNEAPHLLGSFSFTFVTRHFRLASDGEPAGIKNQQGAAMGPGSFVSFTGSLKFGESGIWLVNDVPSEMQESKTKDIQGPPNTEESIKSNEIRIVWHLLPRRSN